MGMTARHCVSCGHDHGPLYICESYSPELKAELRRKGEEWDAKIVDPEWLEAQRENSVGNEILACQRWFICVTDGKLAQAIDSILNEKQGEIFGS